VAGLDSTAGVIALAAVLVAVLAAVLAVAAHLRTRRLLAAQRAVLGEAGEADLVAHALATRQLAERLRAELARSATAAERRFELTEDRLERSISGVGVLRYDAFNETSGRQSSSIALLDERGDGVVLSAILQREQARLYAKAVRGGDSELELSPEEREAIRQASAGQGERSA
jgi:hypothetical protein